MAGSAVRDCQIGFAGYGLRIPKFLPDTIDCGGGQLSILHFGTDLILLATAIYLLIAIANQTPT
jgi:hypothetical protein